MLSVVCAGLLGVPVPVSAQMDNSSVEEPVKLEALFDPNEGSGELRAVKEKIQALLLENEELASQARSLKRESLDLQEKAARFHAATGAAGTAPAGNQEWPEQNVENVAKPGQPQSLRLLRLYDLQYQKKELELKLKFQELALKEKREAHDREIAALQKELEQNTIQEKQLAGEAREFKKQNVWHGYELECLKQENILLKNKLKLLKKTSPEFVMMGEKLEDLPPAVGQDIRQKEAQREQLQEKIAQLETGLRLSPAGADVSVFETQFRGFVERLEKENGDLRERIFSLQEKIRKE